MLEGYRMKSLLVINMLCMVVAFVLALRGTWKKADIIDTPERLATPAKQAMLRQGTVLIQTAKTIFIAGSIAGIAYWGLELGWW
jgi:hypothetical protein